MARLHSVDDISEQDEPTSKWLISPVRLALALMIVIGVVLVGKMSIDSRNSTKYAAAQTLGGGQVLGQSSVNYMALGKSPSADFSFDAMKGSVTDSLNLYIAGLTLSAADSLNEFIYANTIERLINSLIDTLPFERQQKYGR